MDETQQDANSDNKDEFYLHRTIIVDPGQQPLRLDKFLLERLEKVSRNRIQNAIKQGYIKVNDKQVKANHLVKPNESVTLVLPEAPRDQFEVLPEDLSLNVVFEDDDILIVNKPPGMVVHPGVGNYTGTLVNGLSFHIENTSSPVMDGNPKSRPFLVHRIDKDTSGLLVVAKTEMAMSELAKQFFDHSIERTYVAFVWGNFEELEGTITGNIGRDPKDRLKQTVFPEGDEGKEATTHYKVLEDLYYISVVQCNLETGRTHQIRVHMKYKGHPIFNDFRYGGNKIMKGTVFTKYKGFVENTFKLIPRQALHAKSLGFIHPRTGEKMTFDSDLPEDMTSALERWRAYLSSRKDKM